MAIITFGATVTGARGSVGGITFSANKSGPFIKEKGLPPNPRTPKQAEERGNYSKIPGLWNALTAVQQAAWDTFAALPAQELTNSLGENYFASGFNWFTKCNVRLLRVGRSTITATPTQARPAAPDIDEFIITESGTATSVTTGGTPSADSEASPDFLAADAFNGDPTDAWASTNTALPHWLRYDLAAGVVATAYRITAWNSVPERSPKDWTFEAWNGSSWDTLDTVTGETGWTTLETREFFLVGQDTSYTDYRINVSANESGNQTIIGELGIFVDETDLSRIEYPSGEFDNSPDYDLIAFISQGRTTGTQVQYPGFRETVATQSPGDDVQPIQSALEAVFGTIPENRAYYLQLARQTTEGIRSAFDTDRTVSLGA
jgi:hypothetical protein